MSGYTYAIGDLHGCLDPLDDLIRVLRTEEGLGGEDKLVFVGDYIDRGSQSREVIDYLLELRKTENCIFLLGNHEDMMLHYLGRRVHDERPPTAPASYDYSIGDYWLRNGGDAAIQSYGGDLDQMPASHMDFFQNLEYYYLEGNVLFVHAGVSFRALTTTSPEEAVTFSNRKTLLWDRDAVRQRNHFGTIVYGHTPHEEGVRWNRRPDGEPPYSVGIDVGPVFREIPLLAAVRTNDWKEIWSVEEK